MHQPLQYQYTSQAMPQSPQQAYTISQQQQGTVQAVQFASSNSSHVGSPAEQPTAVVSGSYAPPPTQYAYPELPGPAELGMPQGNQTGSYGAVPRTVITSGAMGGDAWSRPNSRPVSPGNQQKVSQAVQDISWGLLSIQYPCSSHCCCFHEALLSCCVRLKKLASVLPI